MNTWELPLAAASSMGLKTFVVVPDSGEDHHSLIRDIAGRFHLDLNRTGFWLIKCQTGKSAKDSWPARDKAIAAIADFLIPISIRPGGNLEKLLNQYSEKILNNFRMPYRETSRHRPKYAAYHCRTDLPDENILIHFTRSAAGPWPDETDFEFYRAMIDSGNQYCRSARESLLHILNTKTIYASARNIRDGCRVVGFTRLSPENMSDLFRYRPRLVNPYFEPYGVGITISAADRTGIRPVLYGLPQMYPTLAPEDRPFFQNMGGNGGRWKAEQEWRHLSDFGFENIPESELCVFVPDNDEARFFRNRTGLQVEPLLAK